MPKKLAVLFQCERCPRHWFVDYQEGEDLPESPSFAATLSYPSEADCREISFEVLCTSCAQTIQNAFDAIGKTDKKSPERGAKEKDPEGPSIEVEEAD